MRAHPNGKGRPEIDREVEPAKNPREQMLVRFAELVADVGRNAWLNSARTGGDEDQTDGQDPFLAELDAKAAYPSGQA